MANKTVVFEFSFDNSWLEPGNLSQETRWFRIDVDYEVFQRMDYEEAFLDGAMDIEAEYGVHDAGAMETDDTYIMQFSSYEIAADRRDAVMQAWKDYFTERHGLLCGPVEIRDR